MNTRFAKMPESTNSIVYVRAVAVADLPQELQVQIDGLETVYSVHRHDGMRVALVADKKLAFDLARQNDLAPVSVH
jgi:hypothetical protein